MKFVKPLPAKGWKLHQLTKDDGTQRVLSGYGGGIPWTYDQDKDGNWTESKGWGENRTCKPIDIKEIDNFVFEAAMKYVGYRRGRSAGIFEFEDQDGVHYYETGMNGMDDILLKVSVGTIKVENGYFHYTWTFKKQGSEIYIYPYAETAED